MTPHESAALVAERLPRALAKASGVKWWTLDAIQRAEMAAEAMALLHDLTQTGLAVLPLEYFSNEKSELSIQSQDGQSVRTLSASGEAGETVDASTDNEGVRAFGDGTQERVVPKTCYVGKTDA